MTRPIYEPSTDRALAYQGWGQRQLFRRPAPISDSTIPWCRLGAGTGTATTATWTNADMQDGMMYNTVPGDVYTITDEGDRLTVDLEAEGLYIVDFLVQWTDTFVKPSTIHAQGVTSVSNDWLYTEFFSLGDTKHEMPAGSTFGPFDNFQHVCGMAWVSSSVGDRTFDPQVHQQSGVNRGFDALSLRFMYFGPIGAEADWEFVTT